MRGKKANSSSIEELEDDKEISVDAIPSESVKSSQQEENRERKDDARSISAIPQSLKPMERRKKRKTLDKERHQIDSKSMEPSKAKKLREEPNLSGTVLPSSNSLPEFHISVFKDLSSPELSVREAAAEALILELHEIQNAYEKLGEKGTDKVDFQMEAEKGDGLENCAPSLRYAVRRLIHGVSSSRECARQGFALGLTIVVGTIPTIKVDSLMKLIVDLLEVSSSMKGQEARDCLLGHLFAYGALARSGRITSEWISDNNTSCVKDFIRHVISLALKKRYLREPAVSVILDLVEKLPVEALLSQVLEALSMHEWFQKAGEVGDPDALLLALKLQERVPVDSNILGKLLPYPFSPNSFFTTGHLSFLVPCFKESTFCQPRVHSLWPVLINILTPEVAFQDEDATHSTSSKKHKRSRMGSSSEEIAQYICCFYEVVIEGSLLLSSHDRKHLAFDVLLLILPRLPASCIQIVISQKLVHCLMDILSTKGSWLYNAAQHFLKELINWVGDDDNRRVAVIVSLQKHSNGRFDCITRTQAVKELVGKFKTGPSCMLLVHHLICLFLDEGGLIDEPSDLSQTTDENSERGSIEDKDSAATSGSADFLKNWVIDTLPRILKNMKLNSEVKNWAPTEIVKFLEAKFRVQTEIMKFLVVQGLFSASLGTEVTSFELEEKFKWPKAASSSSLCKMCIEQLQSLLEDAQRGDGLSKGLESNDLGSYFVCFLSTLCNIPSVSLFRPLSTDDEKAFKKLQSMGTRFSHEERNLVPGADANKLRALRYLLIQVLLQVLLRPGEFAEAASELVICCKKSFPGAVPIDSSEEEDEFDDNGVPELMDVLLDTLLSLLPQSSSPLCFAVEQVFRCFCDDISDGGLLRMLHVMKKDLKPSRHQATDSDDNEDDDDDDDFLGIEDAEETNEDNAVETNDGDDHAADVEEETNKSEAVEADDRADDSKGMVGVEVPDQEDSEELSVSDASDSGMDDEAMLQMDSYFTQLIRGRKSSAGNDSAHSQLMLFKLRVLSLLEIYLHRNPGGTQVFTVYSYLARTFVKSHSSEGNKQLQERIGGILQKKIFKAKEYPKGNEIQLSTVEMLLEKSLRSASSSRLKAISSLAQNSTFWILKIIDSGNFSQSELERVLGIFRHVMVNYFDNKKCRLKLGFVKEVIRRHPWVGHQLFGFLMEKCVSTKSEFRQVEALDVLDCILKSWIPTKKGDKEKDAPSKTKLLKGHLPSLGELIHQLLSSLPEKPSRRAEVRRFCAKALHAISMLNLNKSFLKTLKPDAYSACESQLGNLFLPFKQPTQ